MTLTLKQVTSVTVTGASNQYGTGVGRASILNPSTPIIVFDINEPNGVTVGVVNGTTGSSPPLIGGQDSNYLVLPSMRLQFLGINYAIGGGQVCSASGCMQNGSGACGPWLILFNSSTNNYTFTCSLIPNNPVTGGVMFILADTVSQYLIMGLVGANDVGIIFIIIPFTELSTFVSGTYPSTAYYLFGNSSTSGMTPYIATATIWNGTLWMGISFSPSSTSTGVGYWQIPLSTLYSEMTTSLPTASTPMTTIGTATQIATTNVGYAHPLIWTYSTISSGSVVTNLALIVEAGTNQIYFWSINPSTSTASSAQTINMPYTHYNHTIYNSVLVSGTASSSTVTVAVFDPKSGGVEQTSVPGVTLLLGGEGYIAVATSSMANSSYGVVVYQILLDHTYVIQNPSITVSGSTITATGTLYDLTAGAPVSGATVWLTAVQGVDDNFQVAFQTIASATTNSNGQFKITGSVVSGVTVYGILYVP